MLAPGKKWEKVCKGGLKYGLREKWTTEGNRRKRVYQVKRSMRQHRSPKYIFGIDSNSAVYHFVYDLRHLSKFTYAGKAHESRVYIIFRVVDVCPDDSRYVKMLYPNYFSRIIGNFSSRKSKSAKTLTLI